MLTHDLYLTSMLFLKLQTVSLVACILENSDCPVFEMGPSHGLYLVIDIRNMGTEIAQQVMDLRSLNASTHMVKGEHELPQVVL